MTRLRLIDLPKEIFKLSLPERLLVRLTQQKPAGHFFARFPPLNTRYSKGSLRRVERDGIHFELDLSDYMEWLVFWGIEVEPRQVLYQLVKPGDFVFDVGANIGEVTMNMARKVGRSGFVHSFEPSEIPFKKLEKNLALNNFANIQVHPWGLGDREEELVLQPQVESNLGGSRIFPHLEAGKRVKLRTLDSFVATQDIRSVDLIKIDVEGFETRVIRGAQDTLKRFHPTLFVEVNDQNLCDQGTSAVELISILKECGYREFIRADTRQSVDRDTHFSKSHFDLIAK